MPSDTTVDRNSYALDNDATDAAPMLDCLSAILDPGTEARLAGLIRPGAYCLEIGAGNGSVAGWMAEEGGRVVAVDIKPQHVRPHPGVTVLGRDVATDGLPLGPFDVIHARLLLAHLPARREILTQLVERLRPGGALLVEEWGGFVGARLLYAAEPGAIGWYERYQTSLMHVFAAAGNDPHWCVRVPAAMRDAGLVRIDTFTQARSWSGGTPGCRLPILVSKQLQDQLIVHGMDAGELTRLRAVLDDPWTVVQGNLTWSTLGFRAPDEPAPGSRAEAAPESRTEAAPESTMEPALGSRVVAA